MPLKVIVVGAGIAGLTAAAALCRDGHTVQIFEKSSFKTEVGAALNLLPNGAVVLDKLGFDFARAMVGRQLRLETINGISLDTLTFVDLSNVEKVYGGPVQSVLRADLHSELLRITQEGANPAVLRLGSPVKRVDSATGEVELESGDVHTADLIIGTDGAHSICRKEVLGYEKGPAKSGKNAFRFLIRTEIVDGDEAMKRFIREKPPGANIFADVEDKLKTRHLTWYECHGGAIQNFVGIFPAEFHVEDADQKSMLLQQFHHFHPDIVAFLNLADDVRVWPLLSDEPLERYTRGKLLLLGDAAHTMLPFGAQGANQAIEGAGLTGLIFKDADEADVVKKVQEFETLRRNRIRIIKLLSNVRFGRESDPAYSFIKHDLVKPEDIPRSFHERLLFEWGYNVYDEFEKRQNVTSQTLENGR